MKAPRCFFAALLPTLVAAAASDWPCVWTSWPRSTPSSTWPDGPFVGNGNEGLVVGGGVGLITIYGSVHGFWSNALGKNSTMPPLHDVGSSFPLCPGPTCNITVGLTLMRLLISSPAVDASWTATLDISKAATTVTLGGVNGASLVATLYTSATTHVSILELTNAGRVALPRVNVTLAANNNVQHVPLGAGCPPDATGALAPCPATPSLGMTTLITKDANTPQSHSSLPIVAAASARLVSATGGWAPVATSSYDASEEQSAWATGSKVDTQTRGVTSVYSLSPGATLTFALSMASSQDPGVVGVTTPAAAVTERVLSLDAPALAPLRAAHEAWWVAFWSQSSVTLDASEADTTAFWWSSIYALGSGTRKGQPPMDLWSPWRTTDYSAWR